MSTRVGYPRQMLRSDLRIWITENRVWIAQMVLVSAGLCVLGAAAAVWMPSVNDYVQGMITGAAIMLIASALTFTFLASTSNMHRLLGAWAEDSTDAELEAAVKAGLIHGHVGHLQLAGHDIDALVVTSTGVVVVDTKWHHTHPSPGQLVRDASAAWRAAGHARSVLRSLGHADVPVQPVVALWGPHRDQLHAGTVVDGVPVLAGDGLRTWLASLDPVGPLKGQTGRQIRDELEQFAQTHGPSRW